MSDNRERAIAEMLAEGLDLCVRARKIDEPLETIAPDHPDNPCMHPVIRCATPRLWVMDQYDQDLEQWESRARKLLMEYGYA